MDEIIAIIARELNIPTRSVQNTVSLLDDGATIPFISRYRKEATGALDEVKIESIFERLEQLRELQHRKDYILKSIASRDLLTDELEAKISASWDAVEIEDLYLPFKPKRKTRAEIARQRGLEPLAKIIMAQHPGGVSCTRFITEEVPDAKAAIAGAKDIIAEWVNEDTRARQRVRNSFEHHAIISSKVIKGKEKKGVKYSDYFDFSEPLKRCSSHRLLAMRRGEEEGILRVTITPADDPVEKLESIFVKGSGDKQDIIREAIKDAYVRLLKPAIENEFAKSSKEKADAEAIEVFASNLKNLLLSPPLGAKGLIAIDPGFRTGCKVVVLDSFGDLLTHDTIYPHGNTDKRVHAEMKILKLVDHYRIRVIAIGSGTAGRQTREFIQEIGLEPEPDIYMVNEDGASVYSASQVARRELPGCDVTVRGAVSIGRRLMDPLSELVKIDAKSIGVGQYQHDVDQSMLKQKLQSVTEQCVNSVGVNVNIASAELLTYVSGLGPSLAQNIITYRSKNGNFTSRRDLLKVPRLGPKAFEQCAGFLRIPDASNPLDNSAVHPESYHIVENMTRTLGCTIQDLMGRSAMRPAINLADFTTETAGLETLRDIMRELEKPGRDPRPKLKKFEYDDTVSTIDDLKVGMILPGIVTNVTKFGCFVDLGIKVKGLVHISEMANERISDPSCVVAVQQHITVKIISLDTRRGRIGLSMKAVNKTEENTEDN